MANKNDRILNGNKLTRLVAKIKQALNGKQDKKLVVNITISGTSATCDTSITDIIAAYNNGKQVEANIGGYLSPVSFVATQGIVVFYYTDTSQVHPRIYEIVGNSGGTDSWQVTIYNIQSKLISGSTIKTINGESLLSRGDLSLQPTLVSGNNIKTVNDKSLLGSGNVALDGNDIHTSVDDPNGNWAAGDPIDEALIANSNAINALDEDKQDTLVSGTNIKTINNNSLLGSGDIALDGSNIDYTGEERYNLHASETVDQSLDNLDTAIHNFDDIVGEKILTPTIVEHSYIVRDPSASRGNITTSTHWRIAVFKELNEGDNLLVTYTGTDTTGSAQVAGWYTDGNNLIHDNFSLVSNLNGYARNIVGNTYLITVPDNTIKALALSLYTTVQAEVKKIGRIQAEIHGIENPNEIESITTTESSASGGNNTVTITETDGTTTTFNVKNGVDGVSLGEIALVQTTGDSEESVMSQKAATDELIFPDITLTESDFDNWVENYYFTETGRVYSSAYACNEKFVDIRNYDKVSFSGQNTGILRIILYNEKGEFLSSPSPSLGVTYTRSVYPKMAYFRIYMSKTTYQSATFTFTLSEGHSTRDDVADVKRSDMQVLHTAFKCNQDKTVKVYEGARMTNKTIVIFANAFNSYQELTTGTINIRYGEGWCNIYKNDSTSTTLCRFSQNRGMTKQSISMVLTFDDTGNMKVYLNGILKASCTYDNLPDEGWDIYLGRQIMSHFSIINCALDDYLKVIERNGWMDWLPSLAWTQKAQTISASISKGGWIGTGYRAQSLVHANIKLTNNTSSSVSYFATNMIKYPSGNVDVEPGTTENVECLIEMLQQCSFGVFGSNNQANLSASATGDYVVFEWGMDYRYCHNGGHYNLAGLKWEDVPSLGLLNQEMVKKVCEPEHTYSNTGSAVGQISVDSNGNIQMFNGSVWKQINNS